MPDIFDDLSTPDRRDPANAPAKAMSIARGELPKRFYRTATFASADDGYRVLLDGRPVRTPARAVLAVPFDDVAEALAAEWNAQGERIDPASMPLTRIVNIAIDGVGAVADAVKDEIVAYAGTDLLVYRADGPARLVKRQTMTWDTIV
ncbi:MAG TPA: ATP12 family chaperone protein, partial [Methylomirabilota bacterium]|nr:ATP12 family chaperone protein [Methylomirabilota bacterium]